ncbi:Rrf2 family transcriptional regulator [uncultured Roseobacter sp.]|uniref:RrF2 family transcriptional regulator n=1 Tax=uncultured Roseobacter sp. TaxID=114847 RepID=UPI00261E227E|nr:Rrf2 family transcriptional regulator [uncultured Roseobacter sp.]
MPLYAASSEYALHSLVLLAGADDDTHHSTRSIAEFQGLPAALVAKLFTKLQRAGLVAASEGVRGGFVLAKSAETISVLDVVDAVEGQKALFACRNIRKDCVLFDGNAPNWAKSGVCAIHSVMLEAEKKLRSELRQTSISDLSFQVASSAPDTFGSTTNAWLADAAASRRTRQSKPD